MQSNMNTIGRSRIVQCAIVLRDLLMDRDLESLRVQRGRHSSGGLTNHMSVPFQAGEAKRAINGRTVLQDFARCCFDRSEKLGA